jgi:hypothetical protein
LLPPPIDPAAYLGGPGPVGPSYPEVPVIPEADTLFLVAGAVLAIGGLAGYRRLRDRRND